MKNLSKLFPIFLSFIFLANFDFFEEKVFAQEVVGFSTYEEKQVLVRYTDEAERAVFTSRNGFKSSSAQTESNFFDSILSFLGLTGEERKVSSLADIRETFAQVTDAIGIREQISLERKLAPKTIKLERAKITSSPGPSQEDPLKNVYLVKFSLGSVQNAVDTFLQSGLVTEAQPNFIYQSAGLVPNDPQFDQMWNLQKIRASDAWEISKGTDVVVAVVDSGVDYTHPDLAANMWTGTVNGQTVHGWDFIADDSNTQDGSGHGTHVAGTIAAVGDNGEGVVGVNWKAKIMAVKVIGSDGKGSTATVALGVRFAADNGAKVINLSLGSVDQTCGQGDQITGAAISYATNKGSLSVVAAGNNRANAACFSPANHPDVLAVSAVGPNDEQAGYSNYGLASWKETKIVAAPGGNAPGGSRNCTIAQCILSTWPGGDYNDIQGTSMASPHVAGLAALVLSKRDMAPLVLREHLVNTADDVDGDFSISQPNPRIPNDDRRRSLGKRINAYRALAELSGLIDPTVTPQPGQPTATGGQPTVTEAVPTVTPPSSNEEISIWTTAWMNGQEIDVPNGSKLPKGTLVSILYNRDSGFIRLTVDRGGGLARSYTADCIPNNPKFGRFCQPLQKGFLHAGSVRFFPLGELATSKGSPHVYTLESGGQSVSTTIYVTTGTVDFPTIPTSMPYLTTTPSKPTATPIGPTSTPVPTVTPDPNVTFTPTPSIATGEVDIDALIDQVSEEKIREYLKNLVDNDGIEGADELQTRFTFTTGNGTEADYIASHFQSIGFEQEDWKFQQFTINGYQTRNIIAKIDGEDLNQFYLVIAHMDSTSENPTVRAPGADDNGSGTAAVMEAARVLKSAEGKIKNSLEFVLFSGEEQGLFGSQAYVESKSADKEIKGVINLDMIANQGENDCLWLVYKEINRDKILADILSDINEKYNIGLTMQPVHSGLNASDHAWFWAYNIPATFGFECSFSPVYHSTNDTTDHINFSQLTKMTKTVVGALAQLANQ